MEPKLLLVMLYAGNAFVALFGYLPQIYRLAKNQNGHNGFSLTTWLLWSYTTLIALLYGVSILKDTVVIFVFLINFLGTTTILLLSSYQRFLKDN